MAKAFGRYLLDWEQQRCDEAVADIFGYHSLQLGSAHVCTLCVITACPTDGWQRRLSI